MYVNDEPLFPFGHGLSYTTFKYRGLKLFADKIKAGSQAGGGTWFSIDSIVAGRPAKASPRFPSIHPDGTDNPKR